tara:strand:- start:4830 stop:4982 length:153 start_codon:yes stop_codon:yes gene_type:complete
MDWMMKIETTEDYRKTKLKSNFLAAKFPYKTELEWFCILTQVKFIEDLIE